jgi:chorismate dehydratase
LLSDSLDIGLVPVAVLPRLPEYHIVSNYGIGCDGEVASVCLFGEVPLEEMDAILLDYQSRTSVRLLKILMRDHWKQTPAFIETKEDFTAQITGHTGGLVIGDRAFAQRHRSAYVYDLGTAWKEMTGYPFVFAVWASTKPLPEIYTNMLNRAAAAGLEHISDIVASQTSPGYDLQEYYTKNIRYRLTPDLQKGLTHFLKLLPTV